MSNARRFRDWAAVAELLHGHRAAGAPVEELALVVGVTGNRVRAICRQHPAEPDEHGDGADLLAASGWVLTAAAELLGVSVTRLDRHAAAGHQAGVAVYVGWFRRWHVGALPGWWEALGDARFTRAELARRDGAGWAQPRGSGAR